MAGYVKVFGSILKSTVWRLPLATKVVWLTMLADCDRDGIVEGSIPGLADLAKVTLEECEIALNCFLSPDPYSRTKEQEGRRIEVIDGGWRLINYEKYRDKLSVEHQRSKAAERQKRWRDRHNGVTPNNPPLRAITPNNPIAEASAKAEAKVPDTEPRPVVYPKEFDLIWTQTSERGGKDPAFKVWTKVGRPSWSVIQAPYAAYLKSERPMAGERYIQNLSTWLTNRGWEKEWKPASKIKTSIEYDNTGPPAKGLINKSKGSAL